MKNIIDYKVILWDFDGVIMDSMPIRDKGFEEVLKDYPEDQVEKLMIYHRSNGGLSRYVKFRYFFEEIRKEPIADDKILVLANKFSEIMLMLLMDEKLLIQDSCHFIRNYWKEYDMHIVSGSDGKELAVICQNLGLTKYFKTINGSPTPKKEIVRRIITEKKYPLSQIALIGDSINDYEASEVNQIVFFGYNNRALLKVSENYIEKFS
jgi:phosphoglycolate phosphatase-like HAD superfamily hydrolase